MNCHNNRMPQNPMPITSIVTVMTACAGDRMS